MRQRDQVVLALIGAAILAAFHIGSQPPAHVTSSTDNKEESINQSVVKASAEKQEMDEADARQKVQLCRQNIECFTSKHWISAEVLCGMLVERKAKYEYKWVNGWTAEKFNRKATRWIDRSAGIIKIVGDKVQYQNGFGAWMTMNYACSYDATTENVVALDVSEGRLFLDD